MGSPVWGTFGRTWAQGSSWHELRLSMHLHALQVMSNDGSGEFRMTTDMKEKVMAAVTSFGSKKALRCLALASKHHSGNSSKVGPCHHVFDSSS